MDSDCEMVECRNDNEHTTLTTLKVFSLTSATVVASRLSCRLSMQYKMLIETEAHGSFALWHSYRAFRALSEQLATKKGYKNSGITKLPKKQRFPYLNARDQVAKLNEFLTAAVEADGMRWGIRLNEESCVVKHRRHDKKKKKNETRERVQSNASTETCASATEPPPRAPQVRRSRLYFLVPKHSC